MVALREQLKIHLPASSHALRRLAMLLPVYLDVMVNKGQHALVAKAYLTEVMKMQIAVPIDCMVKSLYVVKGDSENPDKV